MEEEQKEDEVYSEDEEAQIKERLKNLGYL